MAQSNRNYRSTAQASNSGFWETYETDIPEPFSEYKKPSCEDYVTAKKKKNATKKNKPAPELAAVLFASGVEETNKKRYAQPEPASGPNAWSTRSGSALFLEPPPDHSRRHTEPYYPAPQSEVPADEEEMLRRAIEESMRTAQEEEERKRRRDKEEEEWLSQVVKDLIKEDKPAKMSEERRKVTRKYSGNSTDSDDFLTANASPTTDREKSKSSVKLTPKKQTQKSKPEAAVRKQDTTAEVDKYKLSASEPHGVIKIPENKAPKLFSSNLYDNYDDDGSELDETGPPVRSTYWHPRNESHKWNAETWDAGRSHRAELPDSRNRKNETRSQRNRMREELPDTRNYRDKGPHNRHRDSTSEELPDTRYESRGRKENHSAKGTVKTLGSGRSRNFKTEFFHSQSEEIEQEAAEQKKRVQFATDQSTYISNSETDSGMDVFSRADAFASNKSNFDVSLYSNQYQKSQGLPIEALKRIDNRRNEKLPMSVSKTNARGSWKESLQSDEKENKDRSHEKSEVIEKKGNVLQTNEPKTKQNVRTETEVDDLGPSLSDLKLNELPADVKATMRDEIKAEVKLPQDNNIYNFYHNKQLGIQNTQEHLILEGFTEQPLSTESTRVSSPGNNFDAFLENWSTQREEPVPPSTSQSFQYSLSTTSTTPGQGYDYYTQHQVPSSHVPTSLQVPYTPFPNSSTLPNSDLRATSTPLPPISPPATFPPQAPSTDSLPFPNMVANPTTSDPFVNSSVATADSSLKLWRQLLSQAENEPVMLDNLNMLLKRSIDACSNPNELETLISFLMEVDAAIRRYKVKSTPYQDQDVPQVAEHGNNKQYSEVEAKVTGRGRGKRTEPRDHLPGAPGTSYPAHTYYPTLANTNPGHFPIPANSYPTFGNPFNYAPNNGQPNLTHNAYPNPGVLPNPLFAHMYPPNPFMYGLPHNFPNPATNPTQNNIPEPSPPSVE